MRSLADYYHSAADFFAWWSLCWQVTFKRALIFASEIERDSTTCKEVRTYMTEKIAEHQAALDRLYINNLPLIQRMQAKGTS